MMLAAAAIGVLPAPAALAQWVPDFQTYTIERIGFFDAEHTSPVNGAQDTDIGVRTTSIVTGISFRYRNPVGGSGHGNGITAWAWLEGKGTQRLGYVDAEHTRSDGLRESRVDALNEAGRIVGTSFRYQGADPAGRTLWTWTHGSGTLRLGYHDAAHTRADGTQASTCEGLDATGLITGTSLRASGGLTTWVWRDAIGLTQVGFADAAHTHATGVQDSTILAPVNGRAIGSSRKYAGTTNLGRDAWVWTPTLATVRIGFFDANYTRGDQFQDSEAHLLSSSGVVGGWSERFDGSTSRGRSAWAWSESEGTRRIGLVGLAHTRNDGFQFSSNSFITSTGQIAGLSRAYDGATQIGQSAWVWRDGVGTQQIGLVGPEYTAANGVSSTSIAKMTDAGLVVGTSSRFSGLASRGNAVWVWSPTTATTRVGLVDSGHTRADNFQESSIALTHDAGLVAGYSTQYNGPTELGRSAWIWDESSGTRRMGLVDAGHTLAFNGATRATIHHIAADRVAGISARYNVSANAGETAWVFDVASGTTHALVFSVRTDTGFASSTISVLAPEGLAFGVYRYFDGGVGDGVDHAFVWRADMGMTDLGDLVDGGISSAGFARLTFALSPSMLDLIVGTALTPGPSGSRAAFVMVPTPGAASGLLLSGCLALRRRR